ncbi:MAG: hypothetical protein HKN91_02245 [Acidimicrobiia bacterium]|nr:hypothetical protein [Acidimicrobiia bacterium]
MIRRIYAALPGPTPVKIAEALILVVIALLVLNVFYNWLGTTYLDPGGTVS